MPIGVPVTKAGEGVQKSDKSILFEGSEHEPPDRSQNDVEPKRQQIGISEPKTLALQFNARLKLRNFGERPNRHDVDFSNLA
jgi:hypothetical protein